MKRFFVFFASVFIFASCQQELLESPSFRTLGSYTTGEIEPPTNVKASQGNYRSITLTWNAAKHATYYNIYESDTKTGKFIKISESTDGSCTYTMQNDPDTQKFYRITSVDSEKNESFPSETIYGTTLATPIITSITQGAGGSSVKVKWYKGITCNEDTYLSSNLIYHVYLLDESRSKTINEAIFPADTLGNKYECVFDKLEAKTNYTIRIDSYLLSDVNHPEISDIIDASTAHSLIPSAPQEFTVSKGTSADNVTLKWKLPNFAEIYQGGYESRPVYFIIWRKEKGESDKKYQKIVPYIGQFNDSKNAKDSEATGAIKFVCDADIENFESTIGGSDCENLTCVKAPDEDAEKITSYPGYIPTTVLAYTDTDVVRGKQYTYKIQSVVDGNGTVIRTDDDCCVEDDGWAISTGIGSISSDVKYADEDTISSIDVKIKLNFEDFDQDYKYVIKEYKSYKDSEYPPTETVKRQGARENVFSEKFSYVPEAEEIYICTYKIEIFDISSDALITTIEVGGSVYVLKNVSDVPKVEDFEVYDGYSNKFVLKWTYIKDAKYILEWNEGGEKKTYEIPDGEIEGNIIPENEGTENEKKYVNFNHTAKSGDKRSNYILYTIVGLQSQKEPTNGQFEDGHEFKTLGTPILEFKGGDYKKIKVEWESVQMAKESGAYTVSAHYKDDAHSTLVLEPSTPAYDEGTKKWYSEITDLKMKIPEEETIDATISGLPIEFKVNAVSSVDNDGTTATTEVSTLGPAGMNVTVVDSDDKNTQIKLSFKKPPKGTNGILIFRTIGDYTHTYYVDPNAESSSRVKVVGKDISETDLFKITGTYFSGDEWYFTDTYEKCTDDNDYYHINQAKIKWGVPCVYTVIPVLNASDYECLENSTNITNKGNDSVAYEKLVDLKATGATPGYGQNIIASKATSATDVKITWEKPFGANGSPKLYYRNYNASKYSTWTEFTGKIDENEATVNKDIIGYDTPKDFMVIYNGEAFVDSLYEDEYEKDDKKDSNNEKTNKGYLFTLDTDMLKAEYGGDIVEGGYNTTNAAYYSERIILKGFDYTKRAVGPTSIELQMLNLDKKDGWVTIADSLNGNNGTVKTVVSGLDNKNGFDLYVENNSDKLRLMPNTFRDVNLNTTQPTSTNGLLKILRSAKHYYRLVGTRDELTTTLGGDYSIYAYRQITDAELIKSTMLVVAEMIKASNMEVLATGTDDKVWALGGAAQGPSGHTGCFIWSQDGLSKFWWTIDNYTQKWLELPYSEAKLENGSYTPHFITLSDPADRSSGSETRGKKASKTLKFLCYREASKFSKSKLIPITITSDISLNSYEGIVEFASSDNEFAAKVTRDGTSKKTYSTDDSSIKFAEWIPININDRGYQGKNTTDGWWDK